MYIYPVGSLLFFSYPGCSMRGAQMGILSPRMGPGIYFNNGHPAYIMVYIVVQATRVRCGHFATLQVTAT